MEFAFWESALVAVLIVVSAGTFLQDLRGKIALIRAGQPDRPRTTHLLRRLGRVVKEVLFQSRVVSGRPVAGLMHASVFGGFVFFSLATLSHFLEPFGLHLLELLLGPLAPGFRLIVAIWAVLVSIGIIGLGLRRFVFVKYSPDPKSYSSGVVALLILGLMLTYLYSLASPPPLPAKINWWAHALGILVFPGLILRSKHFHIVTAPFNFFFRTERLGEILPLNLDLDAMEESEEEITLGLENLGTLTWKERMDFLTCVECRRCTDHCPANLAGQDLDPRGFVLDGRRSISTLEGDAPVIGNVISEAALGQCTSCGACENICPVGIEHLQVLTGAKRAQALATGTGMVAAGFLNDVERTGNALGKPASLRKELIEELELPLFERGKSEYLLWMGCIWNYDPDAKGSVRSMAQVLDAAGAAWGVLPSEKCSGHHSRRQGEEMQFQTLAGENIDALRAAGVEKIIAPCPHCLHTIGREYPQLDEGFRPRVVHHSQFLQGLVGKGAIRLDRSKWNGLRTTYHDPCYLGRFEGEFDAPRTLIGAAGLDLVEMQRSHARSVCCGGGNAGFVREPQVERRVDQVRAEHVKQTGADLLVTACPECKMMLNPAAEKARDIVEVIAEALVTGRS